MVRLGAMASMPAILLLLGCDQQNAGQPVNPSLAFAAGMLGGNSFGNGLSAATSNYEQAEAIDRQAAQSGPAGPTVVEMADFLARGMTQKQVLRTLAYRPNDVQQETCGGDTAAPWPCQVWTYEDGRNVLTIAFQNNDGAWVVGDWVIT